MILDPSQHTGPLHWSADLIGKPWVEKTSGPYTFDCWGLVRFCWAQRRGIELSAIEPKDYTIRGLVRMLRDTPEFQNWSMVEKPSEMDVVVMGHARHPHHVGLWVDANSGGVMHVLEGVGVCFQDMTDLRLGGWRVVEFWKRA